MTYMCMHDSPLTENDDPTLRRALDAQQLSHCTLSSITERSANDLAIVTVHGAFQCVQKLIR